MFHWHVQTWLTKDVGEIRRDILPRSRTQWYSHMCALENWGRGLKFFPWYLFTKHSKKKVIIALQKPSGLCYFKQCKKTKFKRRFCLNKLVHPHPGPWNFPPPAIWLGTSGLPLSLLLRYILFWTALQFFLLVQLFPAPPPSWSVSVANNSFVLPGGRGACISKHFPLSKGDQLLARAVSISSHSRRKYFI